ncbi:restriction endonuclease subunit S [Staphylococcus arlettae]|uniref:restriction endonuclease subunit S n=1 Tax=Staphylococcus arlettae TaxID=29378 RepID=UPI003F5670CF
MTNEVKNVPKLRFQRFEDEWKKKRLKDIVEPLKGNSGENKNLPVLTISAKKGWLNQKERFSQVIAGNSLSKYNELKKGDLSYNKGNSKVALYGIVYKLGFDNALVPNVYKSFRPKPNNVSDFLEKYFHTKILDRQLRRVITSTARMDGLLNISDYDFYNMSLNIPVNNEQKKIGDFFSKLDRQIELEEQKLEKLKEQKKGYMQKIFSQEIRFKDDNGNDYPEWESKKFLDIFKLAPSKNNQIKSSEVVENGIIPVVDQGKDIFLGYSNEKDKAIEDFDNVIVYGDHTTIIKYIKEPFIIGGDGVKLLESNDGSLIHYLYILLQYFNVKPEGYKRHYSILKNKMMNISNTKEEQEKIGDFFNELDELIEKQSSKIVVLKQRKKGFLQKMFV